MAKTSKESNLFADFKKPEINKSQKKMETPEIKTDATLFESVSEIEEVKLIEPEKAETPVQLVKNPDPIIDDMAYAMPRSGRPKTLDGKYHNFTARLREDLYEYALSVSGKDKTFQSVNDYINRLIARDMLSNMKGEKK